MTTPFDIETYVWTWQARNIILVIVSRINESPVKYFSLWIVFDYFELVTAMYTAVFQV